jgi:GTPase SAR1 family protein
MSKKYKKADKEQRDINYQIFLKSGNDFKAVGEVETVKKLPPAMYTISVNDFTGAITFSKASLTHDELVDLPNPVYEHVLSDMKTFMTDEVKSAFEAEGFIYKRSTLIYGAPGTGKTCVINRVIKEVTDQGGLVLFNPRVDAIKEIFKILNSIQPDVLTMIVFEEFDETIAEWETELLSLLDGQVQKKNTIIMATTNYIDRIPARIQRPGRFSTVIEMGFPSEKERHFYLDKKLKTNRHLIAKLVEVTEGFSIDELKETVLSHLCLKQPLNQIVNRILTIKGKRTFKDDLKEKFAKEDTDWLEGLPVRSQVSDSDPFFDDL